MIPISAKPKRFVAALNKFSKQGLWTKLQPRQAVQIMKTPSQGSSSSALKNSSTTRPLFLTVSSSPFSTSPVKTSVIFPHFPFDPKNTTDPSIPRSPPAPFIPTVHPERDIFATIFPTPSPATATATAPQQQSAATSLKLYGPRELNWFTGKPPVHGHCPGVTPEGTMYSLPLVTADPVTGKWSRQALQNYFDNTWTMTEVLLGALQGEEAFTRPPYHELRHPMIFYYGHPAVLYINKLRVAGLIDQPINPYFESVFETGVDEMSWDDLSKNKMAWPTVAEVQQYRAKVYRVVSQVIANLTEEQLSATGPESPLWAVLMGFEHERIHIETSSVLINELPLQFVQFPKGFPAYHPSVPKESPLNPIAGQHYPVNEFVTVPSQRVTLGKPKTTKTFGWDNEYGHRDYQVPAFRATKYKITNGEFLEFVKENGYARPEFWSEQGWKWRAYRNAKWPTFWMRKGPQGHHDYDLRLMFDVVAMPWDWPVCVNYHEATAFANWKNWKQGRGGKGDHQQSTKPKKYRILTELEHRAMRDQVEEDHAVQHSGLTMHQAGYNINLAHASMTPVTAYPPNRKGFHDVFGNAWEWTEDYFSALPGFEIHPYYEDFSTPCFDGLHQVIQGGSFMSTGDEASIHSRFHFRPHFFQHASFRLVEQLEGEEMVTSDMDAPGPFVGSYPFRRSTVKMMEEAMKKNGSSSCPAGQDLTVTQSLAKHFGSSHQKGLKPLDPLVEVVTRFLDQQQLSSPSSSAEKRLIEVGCGPGGLLFSLLRKNNTMPFQTMIGIDHSMELIDHAKRLIKEEKSEEAGVTKVEFRHADPMCLPSEMNSFDVVIIHDVLEKMTSPNALLGRLGGVRGLVRPGGLVVVISSFQWSEDRTPASLWLKDASQLSQRLAAEGLEEKLKVEEVPVIWSESDRDLRGKVFTVIGYQRA